MTMLKERTKEQTSSRSQHDLPVFGPRDKQALINRINGRHGGDGTHQSGIAKEKWEDKKQAHEEHDLNKTQGKGITWSVGST